MSDPLRVRAHVMGARVHIAALASLLLVSVYAIFSLPLTDDARFYVPASIALGDWLQSLLSLDAAAWSRAGVDAAFGGNREHPPLGKLVMALGYLVFSKGLGWVLPVYGCRIGVALVWTGLVAGIWRTIAARMSQLAAWVGACLFASMPRVFFHGHVETLDLVVTATVFAAGVAMLRAWEKPSPGSLGWVAVAFGLALASKVNAPFLVLSLVGLSFRTWRLSYAPHSFTLAMPPVVVVMALMGPVIAFLLWPWLWFDTVSRLTAYVGFHLQHYPILFYFMGTLYNEHVAPWWAPWVMLAVTTPPLTLALAGLGTTQVFRSPGTRGGLTHPGRRLLLLCLWVAVVQLGALGLPGVPVYGGVKLFLPAFPFVAVLAAGGFEVACCWIATRNNVGRFASARATAPLQVAAWLLGGVCCVGSATTLVLHHPYQLSYYSEVIGGLPGAAKLGFERQYYDLAYDEMSRALRNALPAGGTFAVLPNPKEYVRHHEHWVATGLLPASIRPAPEGRADVVVLTHERRWPQYQELLRRYPTKLARHTEALWGVPLFSVHLRDR